MKTLQKKGMLLLAVLMVTPFVVRADVNSDVAELKTRVSVIEAKMNDWEQKKEEMKKKREERRKQRGGKMMGGKGKGGYMRKRSPEGAASAGMPGVVEVEEMEVEETK